MAGGNTTAYRCQVVGGELSCELTTRLRSECATVDDALLRLAAGERVVVAGSDMHALRLRLVQVGVKSE